MTICAEAASEIIGVPRVHRHLAHRERRRAWSTSPTITSTLSSVTSFFALVTALVVSEASSSTTQLIFSPPIDVGSSSIVFFCGMPSDAAGPVAEMVTPMVTSASAGAATASANGHAAPSGGQ